MAIVPVIVLYRSFGWFLLPRHKARSFMHPVRNWQIKLFAVLTLLLASTPVSAQQDLESGIAITDAEALRELELASWSAGAPALAGLAARCPARGDVEPPRGGIASFQTVARDDHRPVRKI
jgi:hypothetical protein